MFYYIISNCVTLHYGMFYHIIIVSDFIVCSIISYQIVLHCIISYYNYIVLYYNHIILYHITTILYYNYVILQLYYIILQPHHVISYYKYIILYYNYIWILIMCLKAEFECQQQLLIKQHRSLNLAVLQQILTKLKDLKTGPAIDKKQLSSRLAVLRNDHKIFSVCKNWADGGMNYRSPPKQVRSHIFMHIQGC